MPLQVEAPAACGGLTPLVAFHWLVVALSAVLVVALGVALYQMLAPSPSERKRQAEINALIRRL
jgi:hypothetical protein